MITQQEKSQLIGWLLQVSNENTEYLNQKSDSLMIAVSPLCKLPPAPGYPEQDVVDLMNKVEYWAELNEIAEEVRIQTNSQVFVGVRGDKSSRPIKS